jgi:hypothetical protein
MDVAVNPIIDYAGRDLGDEYVASPPVPRHMTAAQAAEHELKALGLGGRATAREIAASLQRRFPHGISPSLVNGQTGLPFTPETVQASAYGQIAGSIAPTVEYFPRRLPADG